MKYTEVVKTAQTAVISHVTKNGVVYDLMDGDKPRYTITIPFELIEDAKLMPSEKTIYLSRLIRKVIEGDKGEIVCLFDATLA